MVVKKMKTYYFFYWETAFQPFVFVDIHPILVFRPVMKFSIYGWILPGFSLGRALLGDRNFKGAKTWLVPDYLLQLNEHQFNYASTKWWNKINGSANPLIFRIQLQRVSTDLCRTSPRQDLCDMGQDNVLLESGEFGLLTKRIAYFHKLTNPLACITNITTYLVWYLWSS